jgi:cytochrome P450
MTKQAIPRHPYVPFLGQSLPIYFNLHHWLQESYRKYGSVSQFQLLLMGRSYLCLNKKHVYRVLVENYAKLSTQLALQSSMGPFYNNGLLLRDGAAHKLKRKVVQPAFHHKQIEYYCESMTQVLHTHLSKYLHAGEMIVQTELRHMMMTLALKIFFGVEDHVLAGRLSDAFYIILTKGVHNPLRILLPGFAFRKAHHAHQFVSEKIEILIQQKRQNLQNNLLSQLLMQEDIDDKNVVKMLIEDFLFLLFSSQDTLSGILSFALLHLSKDIERQHELAKFVSNKVGNNSFFLQHHKIPDMLDCLYWEILRLYPPVGLINRYIKQDIELDDWQLKKGNCVILAPLFIHRCEEYWPNSMKFMPERFVDPSQDEAFKTALFPFGLGEHKCLGLHLSQTLFRMVLTNILYYFQLEYVEHTDKIQFLPFTSLPQLKVRIVPKS